MDRSTALTRLKSCEAELRALGVQSLSLFGSTARNEANDQSDVDVAIVLDNVRGGFQFMGRLDHIRDELTQRLGVAVDVVPEPTHPNRIKQSIDKDRAIVF
jgi:predicted nucleotidyltransferase